MQYIFPRCSDRQTLLFREMSQCSSTPGSSPESSKSTPVKSADVQALISSVADDEEANFMYLTRMLDGIDFEMSEGDNVVYVCSPNIPLETENAVLKHYSNSDIKCRIFKYDTGSKYLVEPRKIEDGIMSPYHFCVAQTSVIRSVSGTGVIPLIHCDKSGGNAKLFFLSCAHVPYDFGQLPYALTTTPSGIITVDMIESLKETQGLSITATDSTEHRVPINIVPVFCHLTNKLDGNEGRGWAMDFFLGRMKSALHEVENMVVGGMSDLYWRSEAKENRVMHVKGIEEITDYKAAKKRFLDKELYHGGLNMAIGKLTTMNHNLVLNIEKGKSDREPIKIPYRLRTVFSAHSNDPLLPGQSGSMIYVQEDDDKCGLRVFGIAFAARTVEEAGIGKCEALFIQPLFPILRYLETLSNWQNGKFWTPYEFKNKGVQRTKSLFWIHIFAQSILISMKDILQS